MNEITTNSRKDRKMKKSFYFIDKTISTVIIHKILAYASFEVIEHL